MRKTCIAGAVVLAAALAAGCTTGVRSGNGTTTTSRRPSAPPAPAAPTSSPVAPSTTAAATTTTGAPAPSSYLTLFTEPTAGIAPIYSAMRGAQRSLDLEMYELVDTTAEEILAQDAARGVAVRVVLDKNLEATDNTPAYDYLSSHGVQVAWAPAGFDADHEKAMVVDTTTAWIMTLNIASRYYSNTRDFAVEDTDPADVAAITSVFDADVTGAAVTPGAGDDLVWSPTTSYEDLIGLIESAKTTLLVENEEMENTGVVGALEAAARNGVDVEVVMNDTSEYADDFDELESSGVKVSTYPGDPGLYIHAKAIVVDAGGPSARAFAGSQNFSTASLDYNRELGVITGDTGVVSALASRIREDFAAATPWTS
jgi:phosphatidylserine/phosphatidylglycerophosphate/cardiolipin synthase-like enzyme